MKKLLFFCIIMLGIITKSNSQNVQIFEPATMLIGTDSSVSPGQICLNVAIESEIDSLEWRLIGWVIRNGKDTVIRFDTIGKQSYFSLGKSFKSYWGTYTAYACVSNKYGTNSWNSIFVQNPPLPKLSAFKFPADILPNSAFIQVEATASTKSWRIITRATPIDSSFESVIQSYTQQDTNSFSKILKLEKLRPGYYYEVLVIVEDELNRRDSVLISIRTKLPSTLPKIRLTDYKTNPYNKDSVWLTSYYTVEPNGWGPCFISLTTEINDENHSVETITDFDYLKFHTEYLIPKKCEVTMKMKLIPINDSSKTSSNETSIKLDLLDVERFTENKSSVIYPNPSNDGIFYLKGVNPQIRITNEFGQHVSYSIDGNKVILDSSGVFFVRGEDDLGNQIAFKIIRN